MTFQDWESQVYWLLSTSVPETCAVDEHLLIIATFSTSRATCSTQLFPCWFMNGCAKQPVQVVYERFAGCKLDPLQLVAQGEVGLTLVAADGGSDLDDCVADGFISRVLGPA